VVVSSDSIIVPLTLRLTFCPIFLVNTAVQQVDFFSIEVVRATMVVAQAFLIEYQTLE
jgi:hypothetical protein